MGSEEAPTCSADEHARLFDELVGSGSEVCERAASMFRAMGDPGRLRLLALLSRGECCVSALADSLEDNLSAVSQRLKVLRAERLVSQRREGKHIFYRLADDHIVRLVANALEHARES